MNVNSYEPEIDLKDLFFYILYQWRAVLITALAFSILLGSYKIYLIKSLGEDQQPKEVREYILDLAEYNLAVSTHESNISNYQKLLDQQNLYIEQSVLMQIDPYKKPVASADFFVRLNEAEWELLPDNINLDPTDSIIRIYVSNFSSVVDWVPIETLTGKDSLYLKELLWVNADYNSNTFTVGIAYYDGDIAQKILDIIISQITEKYHNMDDNVNEHTMSIINRSLTYSIDNSLAETQKTNKDILLSYDTAILDCQKKLEELEEPIPPSKLGVLKYAVLGFMTGTLLTTFFYAVAYMFNGRLHRESELKERYGFQLLGTFSQAKKHFFLSGIDHFIEKLEMPNSLLSEEETYKIIASHISNLTESQSVVLVTGTANIEKLQLLTEKISPYLEEICLITAANMNTSADTIKSLVKCDVVVLVEKRHKSLMSDIEKEQEKIMAFNKPVTGYVLL